MDAKDGRRKGQIFLLQDAGIITMKVVGKRCTVITMVFAGGRVLYVGRCIDSALQVVGHELSKAWTETHSERSVTLSLTMHCSRCLGTDLLFTLHRVVWSRKSDDPLQHGCQSRHPHWQRAWTTQVLVIVIKTIRRALSIQRRCKTAMSG